ASRAGSFAVLNADDAQVAGLAAELNVPTLTFGDNADVSYGEIEIDHDGIRGALRFGSESYPFRSHLIGRPHLENLLGAAAATWRLGIAPEAIVAGIEACRGVPGRLESIEEGQEFAVLVDYAHKPDALERTLESLRPLARGRLIVLFGCGGDRDRGKRKLMGEIAGRLADLVVLTSDNPRTEDPESILREVEAGVQATKCTRVEAAVLGKSGVVGEYVVLPERRAAIGVAVASAGAGDVVLIAGKGHEDYQIVGTVKHHLDDREEARRALGDCA
ncbi:MAG: cyanophycin synthetase, partial [bacterium]